MKKQIIILFCLSVLSFNVFAGKPVSKEPSPLSVLESEEEKKSWCESEGYALVLGRNLHYWLYDSYLYHDGDISELVFEIVPKWFQSMDYFVVEDYNITSPNNSLADSVKKLMKDFDSDVSITLVKTEDGKSDYICVNSYDSDSNLYTTYFFYGTKADRAKIDPIKTEKAQVSTSNNSVNNYETFIQEIVNALNKNGKSTAGDKFYENLKICEKAKALGIFYNTNNLPKIIPTFGIHPKDVLKCSKNLHEYDKLCEQSKIIGEIGMDFCWYKEADSEQQEKVLRFFLEHCHNQKKYCVIHTKDAEMQICNILTEYPNAKPIIHWYDGPEKVYKEFIKRGYMQTFGCETIRSKHIQSLLLETPHNLILAETDNPTAETWLGGTNNSVFLIEDIYQNIAKILNMHFEDCFEMFFFPDDVLFFAVSRAFLFCAKYRSTSLRAVFVGINAAIFSSFRSLSLIF